MEEHLKKLINFENMMEKKKMLVTSIFSFSIMFSNGIFFRVVKSRDCVVKIFFLKKMLPLEKHLTDLLVWKLESNGRASLKLLLSGEGLTFYSFIDYVEI